MKAAKNLMSGGGTAAELLQFLWARRLWWLIPFVITRCSWERWSSWGRSQASPRSSTHCSEPGGPSRC